MEVPQNIEVTIKNSFRQLARASAGDIGRYAMRLTSLLRLAVLTGFLLVPVVPAQGASGEKLGNRPSFRSRADPAGETNSSTRAVALLHSFWYEEAVKAFTEGHHVTDPSCAMGFWGVAMSMYYPLWYPPSEATLKKRSWPPSNRGKCRRPRRPQRERDYPRGHRWHSIATGTRVDHRKSNPGLRKGDGSSVYARYPDDREAAVFYALALDATASPTTRPTRTRSRLARS